MLHETNVSSLPQLNEKPEQKGLLLALGLGISYSHICLFNFLLTLTPLFLPSDLLTDCCPPG